MKVGGCLGQEGEGRGVTDKQPGEKSQEENFCGDVTVQYFDWGGVYQGVYICQVIRVYNYNVRVLLSVTYFKNLIFFLKKVKTCAHIKGKKQNPKPDLPRI